MNRKKPKREIVNYVGMKCLHLETADHQPYGPAYPEAIGKIFRLDADPISDTIDTKVAFVKYASPEILNKVIEKTGAGQAVPIKVYNQFKHGDEVILSAKIDFDNCKCLGCIQSKASLGEADNKQINNWLTIVLYFMSD